MIYKRQFEIGLKDIRKNNEITNTALLERLENIAAYHSDSIGYGVNTIDKTHITWVLLEWKLHVIRRPKYGEKININTWARYTNKCYSYRDFEVYDEKQNLCAIATSKWLLINVEKQRIAKIEDSLISKYEPEEGKSVFNILELEKTKESENYESSIDYKVNRADIDVNKHMHNLRYLDLAYEALPEDVYDNKIFNNIRITYKKEIKLGEELKCKYAKQEDKYVVGIYNEDSNVLHSIIELN